jgi:MFS family permease
MIGPAAAGLMIASTGTGWVFLINAASYVAVLCSLGMLRSGELHRRDRAQRPRGGMLAGFRYVAGRPDLQVLLLMLFLLGTFGLNFPIFISTMSVGVFHAGAREYGMLTSAMAVGSVTGALLAARPGKPRLPRIIVAAAVFGIGCGAAAVAGGYGMFGAALVAIGISAQIFTTSTNSLVQIATEPDMRGRVMAILLGIFFGATPLGAPTVGWVADRFGPRWALGVGAASGIAAAIVGLRYLSRMRKAGARQDGRAG